MPKEVVDSVDEREMRRQEAINELIYTERDFVRDMEYLRDVSCSKPIEFPSTNASPPILSVGSSPYAPTK